jgi:hypothetical protein
VARRYARTSAAGLPFTLSTCCALVELLTLVAPL